MKAQIVMVIEENEYIYGTYPFNNSEEKNRINKLALDIREQRKVDVFVREL